MASREIARRNVGQEIGPASFTPWGIFDELRRDMSRLFDVLPTRGREGGAFPAGAAFVPVEVEETDDRVIVNAELPGMSEKDIELSLDPSGEAMVLRGEKKSEREERNDSGVYRSERVYGAFERVIPLPARVDENKIEAHFQNGVLKVEMKKAEDAKSRKKIEIKPS